MNNRVIGTSIVVGALSAYAYKNSEGLLSWMDNKLGVKTIDAAGYIGGALQLGAVTAVSRGWLSNTSTTYHAISLIGSSGLLATAFYHGAMAPVLVNVIWMGMNAVGVMEGVSNLEVLSELTSMVV